ncbi:DUF1353 domain-containing protein [Candidatus Pacearchaeota archaeon]|jgi:hypothetical protein|nr:DUF1353 domain-containing protein [Candidatus Pacearchaeota archaeon]
MTHYGFQNLLQYQEIGRKGGHTIIRLTDDLIYIDTQGRKHIIPADFESDKASIPRTPVLYWLFADRFNREGVLHDATYCIDYPIALTRAEADGLIYESSRSESETHPGKSIIDARCVWAGVRIGGWPHYHKRRMTDRF